MLRPTDTLAAARGTMLGAALGTILWVIAGVLYSLL